MTWTITTLKSAARNLRVELAETGVVITHGRALELVARQLGYRAWNTTVADLAAAAAPDVASVVGIGAAVPVLRMNDETAARAFYLDYRGFTVDWEHRYESGMPLYARLQRHTAVLDLSEHHGDGTPGTAVWLPVTDVRAMHRELTLRRHPRLRPGVDRHAPGGPTMEILDPFGNILRFCQPDT